MFDRLWSAAAPKRCIAVASIVVTSMLVSCSSTTGSDGKLERPVKAPQCVPSCQNRCGIDDGCGTTCACATGQSCTNGECVANAACATCKPGESCVNGACLCTPKCEDNACKPDGCGSTCPCPEGAVQNASEVFVAPGACSDTCASAGWACGSVCGASCGACSEGQSCTAGKCLCAPKCEASSCRDGCGGVCPCPDGTGCDAAGACMAAPNCMDTCASAGASCGDICGKSCGSCQDGQSCFDGQCREATSCKECSLNLQIVGKKAVEGKLTEVTVAIKYQPRSDEPRPRMADLRIRSSSPVTVLSAEGGAALTNAKKVLYVDELTGNPWRVRPDGSVQLLAYGAANSKTIDAGDLAKVTFRVDAAKALSFWLVRKTQAFAPLGADQILQVSTYDNPAVVNP